VLGEVDLLRPGADLGQGDLVKGTVRPGCVVVAQVLDQHPAQGGGHRRVPLQN
jgi:hypothetical protein